MLIDFRKDRTVIPAIKINDCALERVSSYKPLGLWIDDDLKYKTNTEYMVKKAAKRLHFLKILKGYNAPRENLKTFYISAIRSILEFGTKICHGSLTEEQSKDIERIQRHGIKIIYPKKTYEQALIECGMETLENRREKMCIKLINDMKDLIHKLNELLPPTVGHVRERDTRLTVDFTKLLPKYSKFRFKVRKFVAKFKVHIENHKPVS